MFLKRVKKSIALALVTVTMSAPVLSSVYATGINNENNIKQVLMMNETSMDEMNRAKHARNNFDDNTSSSEMFSEEQVKLFKVEFQEINGVEDEFKVVDETNESIIESNGFRGILRLTDKETNKVTTLELFESIDKLQRESIDGETYANPPARPTSWKTQGPDSANMKVVKGSSRDSITVTHPTNRRTKNYTKPTNSWYSGYTEGYYNHVQGARRSYGTAKTKAGVAGTAALVVVLDGCLAASDFKISISEMVALLKKSGATIISVTDCARYAVAYLGEILLIEIDYNHL
ncbi:MAG: hypothetical protein RRY11_13525 [Terrisporobacter sp.]